MSSDSSKTDSNAASPPPAEYQVIARRYRPQTFEQLVGQEHIAQVLANAIRTGRIGHAYLFSGARGVGKTSTARIFAKALNCVTGPTATPCNECDICQSVSRGDDVDVLEIDGASNRGIDEIRELRQNVGVRPSRSRFKIYIIDEVHMLTREAFNALLKTLEEPPEHAKFFFCTTEPQKIPVTIQSRCQRFDFAGVATGSIAERLLQIAEAEGVPAEREAIDLIARRAGGSMRDAQSLLEQVLALREAELTTREVQEILGTAAEQQIATIVDALVDRDAAAALQRLDAALGEGVELGPLLDQLLSYLRDLLVVAAGGGGEQLLYGSPSHTEQMAERAEEFGLATILAAMQIIDHAQSRMRYTSQPRILAEMALVRIARLADLEQLAEVIEPLRTASVGGGPDAAARTSAPERRTTTAAARQEPAAERPSRAPSPDDETREAEGHTRSNAVPQALTDDTANVLWKATVERLGGLLADNASLYDDVAVSGDDQLVVRFRESYTSCKACERRSKDIERVLEEVAGRPIRLAFEMSPDAAAPAKDGTAAQARPTSVRQQLKDAAKNSFVRRAGELFDARPTEVSTTKSPRDEQAK